MNWFATICIGIASMIIYYFYFGHVVTVIADGIVIKWAIKELLPLLTFLSKEHTRLFARLLAYSLSFLVGSGITCLFLTPLRYVSKDNFKVTLIAFVTIIPVFAASLTKKTPSTAFEWSVVVQPVFGFVLFMLIWSSSRFNRTLTQPNK